MFNEVVFLRAEAPWNKISCGNRETGCGEKLTA
jgi:hypothetical protein